MFGSVRFESGTINQQQQRQTKKKTNKYTYIHTHSSAKLKPPILYRLGNIFGENYVPVIIYFENVVVTQFSWNYTFQK